MAESWARWFLSNAMDVWSNTMRIMTSPRIQSMVATRREMSGAGCGAAVHTDPPPRWRRLTCSCASERASDALTEATSSSDRGVGIAWISGRVDKNPRDATPLRPSKLPGSKDAPFYGADKAPVKQDLREAGPGRSTVNFAACRDISRCWAPDSRLQHTPPAGGMARGRAPGPTARGRSLGLGDSHPLAHDRQQGGLALPVPSLVAEPAGFRLTLTF